MQLAARRVRASSLVVIAVVAVAACAVPARASTTRAVAVPEQQLSIIGGVNDPKDPNIAVLEFLPEKIKVAVGTEVTWQIAGPEPHSVTFVPSGAKVPPSAEADPSLFGPTPPTAPYDGSTLVNSGVLPLGGSSAVATFSMSFAKTGTYAYYCVLHPNMVGTLQVTDDTQDSQQKITKTAKSELAKYTKEGEAAKKKLMAARPAKKKGSDGTTTWTVQTGASTEHTDVLAFAPAPAKVKIGDHVTFVNNSAAPHTASFGGTLVPQDPTAPNVLDPVPGPSPQTLAQGVYLNTGWLPPKTPQGAPLAARSYTYDVTTAGKYEYACVLHLPSGMAAEIDAS